MLEIRIGGRVIRGSGRRDNGLVVKPKGFQGWQGLSSVRREALARAVQHGEIDTPVYLGSRVLTIDGWLLGDSLHEVGNLSDSVTGLLGLGSTPFTVTHQGNTRRAEGRVVLAECDDPGDIDELSEFQLQIVCPDPRRYGPENVHPETGTSTSIPVFQYGNFPAYATVEIPSAPSGYTITAGGKSFVVSGATAGGTHTVNMRSGRVYRDGVEQLGAGRGDLWTVPPGVPMTFTLSVAGRVRVTDTFV